MCECLRQCPVRGWDQPGLTGLCCPRARGTRDGSAEVDLALLPSTAQADWHSAPAPSCLPLWDASCLSPSHGLPRESQSVPAAVTPPQSRASKTGVVCLL